MALLKYFNRVNGSSRTPFPNPESSRSLSQIVNRAAIETANEEVLKGHNYRGLGAKRWIALS